jgi:hypothetical protein
MKLNKAPASSARVVDGILILSLPDAIHPVVWQMELGQSKASALEVRDTGEDLFTLVLKTPRQDVIEVAQFREKSHALHVLFELSKAMEKAKGQIRSPIAANENNHHLPAVIPGSSVAQASAGLLKFFLRSIAVIVAFVIVVFGGLYLVSLLGSQQPISAATPQAATSGVPQSADEFLGTE